MSIAEHDHQHYVFPMNMVDHVTMIWLDIHEYQHPCAIDDYNNQNHAPIPVDLILMIVMMPSSFQLLLLLRDLHLYYHEQKNAHVGYFECFVWQQLSEQTRRMFDEVLGATVPCLDGDDANDGEVVEELVLVGGDDKDDGAATGRDVVEGT
jgi:hypothetical protein